MSELQAIQCAMVYEQLARLYERVDLEEAMSFVEAGLQKLVPFDSKEANTQKSVLIVAQSALLYRNNFSRVNTIALAEKGLELVIEADEKAMLHALSNLAIVCAQNGQMEQAERYFEEGAKLASQFHDKEKIAMFSGNLGIIAKRQFRLADAMRCQKIALKAYQELGNKDRVGHILNNLAQIYQMQEEFINATITLQKAIQISKESQSADLETFARSSLAKIQIKQKQYDEASKNLEICHELLKAKKAVAYLLPYVLLYKAEICMNSGQHQEALKLIDEGTELGKDLDKVTVGLGELLRAKVFAKQSATEQAMKHYEMAIELLKPLDVYEHALAQKEFAAYLTTCDPSLHREKIDTLLNKSSKILSKIG